MNYAQYVCVYILSMSSIGTSTDTPALGGPGNTDIMSTSNPAYEVIPQQRQQQHGDGSNYENIMNI